MTTIASLRILLGLESGSVKSGAANVKNDLKGVQREANTTNQILKGIGKGLGQGIGLGAGFGAVQLASKAVSELTGFLSDSVKAAIDEEAGIKRLGQALTANIPAFNGNTAAIEASISAREALGFSDDALRDSLGALAGATHNVGRSFELQSLAMDLARFKNIDLASATSELIKVQAGSFRSLKALGIELKAGASSTEAFAAIQKVVAGQAAAFGETTAGAMEAANVAVHDLQEDIGGVLAPAIKDIANFVRNDLIPALRDLGDIIGSLPWDQIGAAAAVAFGPIANAAKGVGDTKAALDSLTGADARNEAGSRAAGAALMLQSRAASDAALNYAASGQAAERLTSLSSNLTAEQLRVSRATVDASAAHADLSAALKDAQAAGSGDALAMAELAAAEAADQRATDELTAAKAALKVQQDAVTAAAALQVYQALNAGDAWKKYADSLSGAQFTADQLIADLITLNGMHVEATIDLTIGQGGNVEGEGDLTPVLDRIANDQKRLHDQAVADAKSAADKIASAYHDKLNKAFDDMSDRAHEAYAKLHDDNVAAIKDVHDHANALLDEQEKAIRGTVDAERARIQAQRDARTLEGLRANVAGAATPADLEAAKRALGDFLADQRIATLSANADTQIALLEAEKKKNDDVAAAAVTAENARNDAQVKALNKDLANLKDHLKDVVGAWDKAFAEIEAAAKKHHVADIVGVHPVSLVTGSKALAAIPAGINPAVAGVGVAPTINQFTFYLDGIDITDLINIRQAASNSRITSGGIAG